MQQWHDDIALMNCLSILTLCSMQGWEAASLQVPLSPRTKKIYRVNRAAEVPE